MRKVKYHPLIQMDSLDYSPMFSSDNLTSMQEHFGMFLEKDGDSYILNSKRRLIPTDRVLLRIHCPLCGKVMKCSEQMSEFTARYHCERCSNAR